MRKAILVLLSIMICILALHIQATAEQARMLSAEAVDRYITEWNSSFSLSEKDYHGEYKATEDKDHVSSFVYAINTERNQLQIKSDYIPADSHVMCEYITESGICNIYITSENIKEKLEKAVIYTDDTVVSNIIVAYSANNEGASWCIGLSEQDLIVLRNCSSLAMKLTVDGETEFIEISEENNIAIYDAVSTLLNCLAYSDVHSERYLDSTLLPRQSSNFLPAQAQVSSSVPPSNPQTVNAGENSSFRIELPFTDISVYIGNPVSISPSVLFLENNQIRKNAKVSWGSSDKNIAEVKNGRIVGNKVGDVLLTCSLMDDPTVYTILHVHVAEPVKKISVPDARLQLPCNTDGNKYCILPVFEPESGSYDEIIYSSSNEQIASVNQDGIITANAPGKAVITVSVKLNSSKKVIQNTITVTVIQQITSLIDFEETRTLHVGKSEKLAPVLKPGNATNKKLSWESSDASIATVDTNGTVRGKKTGTCTITASSQDGGNVSCEYFIRVIQPVTVVKRIDGKTTPFTGIIFDKYDFYELFTVEPSNASNKELTLSVSQDGKELLKSDGSEGYVISGKQLYFVNPGVYQVTAFSSDGTNKKASITVHIAPEDMNTLDLPYYYYELYPSTNEIKISFDIKNKDYGKPVKEVELYLYATDGITEKIFGDEIFTLTSKRTINPGCTVRSPSITLPSMDKIVSIRPGFHKITFTDGTSVTFDRVIYYYFDFIREPERK